MIDFLKKVGFDDDNIKDIISRNNESSLFDLSCDEENCLRIVTYMKDIGIDNVVDIMIYKIDVFFMDFEEFVKRMGKFNIPVVVDLINSDYSVVDDIYGV